jgi:glycosyltransferase involved in cell wall biosynthesis
MSTCVVFMPCYNAERFVCATVNRIPWARLPPGLDYCLLLIDNSSTDRTWEQIETLLTRPNTFAVHHQRNSGYGGSVKSALQWSMARGAEFLVVLHADGQYAPEELPRLLERLLELPYTALLFGSRLAGNPLRGGMPAYKFVANHLLSALQNLILGLHLSEYHSGYRLYRLPLLAPLRWRALSDGFVFDNEIIFLLHQAGLAIAESPISTYYGEEKSHVPKLGTPLAILANSARYLLAKLSLRHDRLYSV